MIRSTWMVWGLLATVVGCSPTFNWRDVRPEGSACEALFPCKPTSRTRRLLLAGVAADLTVVACEAGGATFGLAFADIGEPARVGAALVQMRESALRNVGAATAASAPVDIPGLAAGAPGERLSFAGHAPDGHPLRGEAALFRRGTRVFQATVLGSPPPAEAVETFFGGLRLPS